MECKLKQKCFVTRLKNQINILFGLYNGFNQVNKFKIKFQARILKRQYLGEFIANRELKHAVNY